MAKKAIRVKEWTGAAAAHAAINAGNAHEALKSGGGRGPSDAVSHMEGPAGHETSHEAAHSTPKFEVQQNNANRYNVISNESKGRFSVSEHSTKSAAKAEAARLEEKHRGDPK